MRDIGETNEFTCTVGVKRNLPPGASFDRQCISETEAESDSFVHLHQNIHFDYVSQKNRKSGFGICWVIRTFYGIRN
jgi:hypothetical protein